MITTRDIVAFASGSLVGGVIGYFAAKSYLEDIYEGYIDRVIEEYDVESEPHSLEEIYEEECEDVTIDVREDQINPLSIPEEDRKAYLAEHESIRIDYASMSGRDTDGDYASENLEAPRTMSQTYFEMVSSSKFESDDGRIKRTLTYYSDEGLGIDDEGQMIDNVSLLYFGNDLDNWFYMLEQKCDNPIDEEDDPDLLYIRDHEHDIDYEIIRIHGAYSDITISEEVDEEQDI